MRQNEIKYPKYETSITQNHQQLHMSQKTSKTEPQINKMQYVTQICKEKCKVI